ncbi:MAG: hypothetical protein EKK45_00820 [Curvibacter sp.]|nr:MAG: hypothetical protein EKK45_00820 [Curvibacter sp.]
MNQEEKRAQRERQDKMDQIVLDRATRDKADADRQDAERAQIAAAAAPTAVTGAAPQVQFGEDQPVQYDDASAAGSDARQAARMGISATVTPTRWAAGGQTFGSEAEAAEAAKKFNTPEAANTRIGAVLRGINPERGVAFERANQQAKLGGMQVQRTEQQEADDKFNRLMLENFQRLGPWQGAARMLTETGAGGLAGATVRPVVSPDGKTVKFMSAKDGEENDMGLTYENSPAGVQRLLYDSSQLDPRTKIEWLRDLNKREEDAKFKGREMAVHERQQSETERHHRALENLSGERVANSAARIGMPRPLTAAQERSNAEIDAARQQVAGLSNAEILRRTAKATNTGRENPDYDPGLARAAALARRRKVGEDDQFDSRGAPARAASAQGSAQGIAQAFQADPAMKGYRLGSKTPAGRYEVLDSTGKLVGHYE